MLSFAILSSMVLMLFLYAVIYIGECIFTGFSELSKLGGDTIDRGIISASKRFAKQNNRRGKTTKST